jgi:acyl-CoA synthetase (AMP-forming)/AMP-acid ligase II/alkylation response protein AidB-like acyl-CoA dehydrogenase/acyl carrier protein
MVDILNWRACYQSGRTAFTFCANSDEEERCVTYGELDARLHAVAELLTNGGLNHGRALLLYKPGLDFITAFFGCLCAGVTPVPTYPLRSSRHHSWLHSLGADAEVSVVLTTAQLLPALRRRLEDSPQLRNLLWLTTDALAPDSVSRRELEPPKEDQLAYLQYTSGSTRTPRGVMITHRNLMHNLSLIARVFEVDDSKTTVSWLPPYHDMGLIGGILQPIYCGIPSVLMSPASFIQRPVRWLQAISRFRGVISGGPNFAYDTCVRQITDQERVTLDLSSWSVAFNGSEPVRAATLEQFAKAFSPFGFERRAFLPCYGLAEATLLVCGTQNGVTQTRPHDAQSRPELQEPARTRASKDKTSLVSFGRPPLEQKVVIVDPDSLRRCKPSQVGEIWVSGLSVTPGYWKKPNESKATLQAFLPDDEGPFLRTGDLGQIVKGELFVVGRMKDVMIIRGVNYHPSDIEQTVEESHEALEANSSAVFSVAVNGDEKIVVLQEIAPKQLRLFKGDEIIESIRRAVATVHQQQVYAVLLAKKGVIHRTPNGKIQRQACRAGFLKNRLQCLAHWRAPDVLKGEASPVVMEGDSQVDTERASDKSRRRRVELVEWLRLYANERINSQLISERRCIPPYIVLDMGNRGILGMNVPERFGGIDLKLTDTMLVLEQLAAIDLTLASFVGVQNALGIPPIMKYATDQVRNELLPLVASGRELAAFALSEPGAGSNPLALSAIGLPGENCWHLRGEKTWIGSGSWAGVISVFVQLLDERQQKRGITGFVLRQGMPGLKQGAEALTLGMRGMVQNRILLNDVPVRKEQLLGEPGAGMDVAQDAMMLGRLGIAAMSIGSMKRCAQLMLRYAERRQISSGCLLDNPLTLVRMDKLTMQIKAMEALVSNIAALLDEGMQVPAEAFVACKITGPEFLWDAADGLVQLLGGRGYTENNIAPQILNDARLLRIFEGPTETMRVYLGERALQRSETLEFLLRDLLNAPDIADKLADVVGRVSERWLKASGRFSRNDPIASWASALSGDLTTFALLEAALQRETERASSPRLAQAIHWTQLQFERATRQALSVENTPPTPEDAALMAGDINDYVNTIGEVEQTMPGVEHELDQLLRRTSPYVASDSATAARTHTVSRSQRNVFAPGVIPNQRAQIIEEWITTWLSQHFQGSRSSLSPEDSFLSYGLDSMSISKLANDMQAWLGRSLPVDLAFEYPTPRELASHLALAEEEEDKVGGLLEAIRGDPATASGEDVEWEVTKL